MAFLGNSRGYKTSGYLSGKSLTLEEVACRLRFGEIKLPIKNCVFFQK
jgi:hypothetical protein